MGSAISWLSTWLKVGYRRETEVEVMTHKLRLPTHYLVLVGIVVGGCSFDVSLPETFDAGKAVDSRSGVDSVDPGDILGDAAGDSAGTDAPGDLPGGDGQAADLPPKECEGDNDCMQLGEPNSCTTHSCDEDTWTCVATDAPAGQECDDGDPCTEKSECDQGECVSVQLKECDDKNPCTSDKCEKENGTCVHEQKGDGTSCDDGVECTKNESCKDGACIGEVNCDDGDACTDDWCDWEGGEICVHDMKPGCVSDCAKEGETLPPDGEPSVCCAGLDQVPVCKVVPPGDCDPTDPDNPCVDECDCASDEQVCIVCWNGNCGPGENSCNCEKDCPFGPGPCQTDSDCFEGAVCMDGQCILCGAEICDDGADNDCDGMVDEEDCKESDCAAPEEYQLTSMDELFTMTSSGEIKVALWGFCIALFNEVACAPEPNCGQACCDFCKAPIALGQGPGKEIFLYPGAADDVGCKIPVCGLGEVDPMELIEMLKETCVPKVEQEVFVWGKFSSTTEEGESEKNISVDGHCGL